MMYALCWQVYWYCTGYMRLLRDCEESRVLQDSAPVSAARSAEVPAAAARPLCGIGKPLGSSDQFLFSSSIRCAFSRSAETLLLAESAFPFLQLTRSPCVRCQCTGGAAVAKVRSSEKRLSQKQK
ncbi:DASH complex subunit DAD3 [Coccidioides immitis RS]|uniref:DASH complex subunit DAD3 n=1 Tax=Coccidioides immitis (strain RS) TaxID=246410 RepID=A0A0D8JZ53_COCIM|nr:DASH complex subunit DAD3 [Coccidioides immitis RS]KJF61548.1 DASH complex subunit DAD3 [Coccidioides immitis RS]